MTDCTNCGKNFTTDDLRGTSCRYCGTLLAHHARAAQQVAVVQGMLADRNGNGIPDAYEGLVANAQANAMNQAFGFNPYGQPPMMGGYPMQQGVILHNGMMMPMNGHAAHQVSRTISRTIFIVVGIVTILALVFTGVIVALVTMNAP